MSGGRFGWRSNQPSSLGEPIVGRGFGQPWGWGASCQFQYNNDSGRIPSARRARVRPFFLATPAHVLPLPLSLCIDWGEGRCAPFDGPFPAGGSRPDALTCRRGRRTLPEGEEFCRPLAGSLCKSTASDVDREAMGNGKPIPQTWRRPMTTAEKHACRAIPWIAWPRTPKGETDGIDQARAATIAAGQPTAARSTAVFSSISLRRRRIRPRPPPAGPSHATAGRAAGRRPQRLGGLLGRRELVESALAPPVVARTPRSRTLN